MTMTMSGSLMSDLYAAGMMDTTWALPLGEGGGRDNFPVLTAWLCELGTEEDRQRIRPRWVTYMEACRTRTPGVYHREPGNPDWNSQDNYTAIIRAGQLLGVPVYGQEIYRHGYNHDWVFDDQDPSRGFVPEMIQNGAREWFGRDIGFPPYAKESGAGLGMTFREQWTFGQAVEANFGRENTLAHNPDPHDVGNYCLQRLQNRALVGSHWMTDSWIRWWSAGMKKRYGDLSGMLTWYFHPWGGLVDRHPFGDLGGGDADMTDDDRDLR